VSFTTRSRSLVTLSFTALAVGLLLRQEPMALSALAVLIWVAMEWANFRWRTLGAGDAFFDRRRLVGQQSRTTLVLAASQNSEVEVRVRVGSQTAGLRCRLEDMVPQGFVIAGGSNTLVADCRGGDELKWSYVLRPTVTRRTMLPGIAATLSDPQGLFQAQLFLPLRQETTVLPFLVRPQTTVSVLKRQNVQLLPGLHRHRKPGYSTELLGIRDYQPGDPPRSIAWKATARLDRLMTCEYESEAPIRGTLLADLSSMQFAGRPGAARADRIVAGCASVARLLLSDGDPVALLVASRGESSWLPHGLGERHLSRLLIRLLSLNEPLSVEGVDLQTLTRLAWTCAYRRYPELLEETVNHASASSFTFGRRRRAARQRRQLGLALEELYGGRAGLAMRLEYDDRLYRDYCRRLLEQQPGMVDLAPLAARHSFRPEQETATANTLCKGLLAGAARANDNELFVIVGTAPREAVNIQTLVDAIRVARAQHHRVMVIDVAAGTESDSFADPVAHGIMAEARDRAEAERYAELERRLARLGAKTARMTDPRLMEAVAAEVELLRSGRARTVRGRI
jgi:uncharacterized protein (DUF58 family)